MGCDHDNPHEKLRHEFGILMGQNNTAVTKTPAYTVAVLFQEVDRVRRKHGVEIADVHQVDHGIRLLELDGGEIDNQMAVIGLEDQSHLADLDDVAMLDDRKIGGRS